MSFFCTNIELRHKGFFFLCAVFGQSENKS